MFFSHREEGVSGWCPASILEGLPAPQGRQMGVWEEGEKKVKARRDVYVSISASMYLCVCAENACACMC